ncbi:flagellar basal-body rod protein FlgG [Bacillota bacterium LX-D]|nr:flagellar basal-body rod protein FlgG [Bacillota bacterium LX-D]
MIRSLWNGASGMTAQNNRMDVITNNLANVNTTGYKKQRTSFSDLLYQELNSTTLPIKNNQQNKVLVGSGVKVNNTYFLFGQGQLIETGRDLDVAILGRGFLEVELPDGQFAYTKDGNLHFDRGQLVNSAGYRVSADITVNPEILNTAKKITIQDKGTILINTDLGENIEAGTIPLFKIDNPSALKPVGQNLYTLTNASGSVQIESPEDPGSSSFKQGYLEGSNVNILEEMVEMIATQRSYQFNSRSIQNSDEMWSIANNLRR